MWLIDNRDALGLRIKYRSFRGFLKYQYVREK